MKNALKKGLKHFKKKKSGTDFQKNSYAQCGEDLIIDFLFNQLGIDKPTYLDIGAHHPFYLSNTALFYEKGCRGINVEPDCNLFDEFIAVRKEDINLNIGIGEKTDILDFFVMNVPTLNTFSKEQVELYQIEGNYFVTDTRPTKIDTVNNILKNNNGLFPDLMSLDAEGVDELIIKNIDFNNKPKVICVETLSFSSAGNGTKNTDLINFIIANGYLLYADTYINTIFVDEVIWNTKISENN